MAEAGGYESPSACSDDDFQPPPLKRRETLKKSKEKEDARFCSPVNSIKEYVKPFSPGNTKVNTRWFLIPDKLQRLVNRVLSLSRWWPMSVWHILCRWYKHPSVLATKIRFDRWKEVLPQNFLLCGLQRHVKEQKQHMFNILDCDHSCDNHFRELCSKGVGAETLVAFHSMSSSYTYTTNRLISVQ